MPFELMGARLLIRFATMVDLEGEGEEAEASDMMRWE